MEDEKETIYVPVSNSDSALRPCLTEENAWKLIEKIPEISTPWTENEKMREQKYKEAIKANDPKALVVIIKMIYQRKQQRLAQGKKCTATDTKYFQIAEKLSAIIAFYTAFLILLFCYPVSVLIGSAAGIIPEGFAEIGKVAVAYLQRHLAH